MSDKKSIAPDSYEVHWEICCAFNTLTFHCFAIVMLNYTHIFPVIKLLFETILESINVCPVTYGTKFTKGFPFL